jgi:UDP-N-acetylglucosamine 2-epimerase (non-hydrolysing)
MNRFTIHLIAAARPNFMKVAPLYFALAKTGWATPMIVHTGQHYDAAMSDSFFADLGLPTPHFHLEVGSGSHATQTAKVMIGYEGVCLAHRPDMVVVVGDVNSTAACAMVAAKLLIPLAHLEAGLRSFDRRMPEEDNRLVTDVLADLLWTPSKDADQNLLREGVAPEKIERVGNIMIDSLEKLRPQIEAERAAEGLGLGKSEYALVTLHRPSNVDCEHASSCLAAMLHSVSELCPLVFPLHPRTRKNFESFGILAKLQANPRIILSEPMPYKRFMNLLLGAKFILTDSGGVQEESSYLGIPCFTLRENTERPITVAQGTNRLIKVEHVVESVLALSARREVAPQIELWDGHTAERIVASIHRRFILPLQRAA